MAGGGSHYDLWMLPLGDSRPPYPFLQSDHSARFAQFSPDSRFVAFSWAQSGRDEIFVRNVDGEKRRSWQISTSGGTQPRWSRDGKQIYFLSGSGKVVSAKVRVRGEEIEIAGSDALFPHPALAATSSAYQYDISPDGDRFVFLPAGTRSSGTPVRIILNWEGLLKR